MVLLKNTPSMAVQYLKMTEIADFLFKHFVNTVSEY